MDMVGKIKNGCTLGKLIEIALGSKYEYLVFIEIHLKLVHSLHTVGCLKHRTDIGQPFIQTRLSFYAFIAPMSSHATFGDLVHTFRTNLHFHPFLFWPQNGDVQTLIAIRLGY